ncbi:GPS-CTERM domain-containing protein [Kitasatospora sp. NPDC059800]|uniref:GPS-CTERM domain-containing protein n=1 Tax=Kitasatospora sp. NPDC059800 TaxID=3346951 RepID=UPI0036464EB2
MTPRPVRLGRSCGRRVLVPLLGAVLLLAAVAPPLRYDANGLLCAIAGFPKAGCADQLGSAAKPAGPSGGGSDSGPDVGLIAGGALIAVLAGGAVWQARRRRTS